MERSRLALTISLVWSAAVVPCAWAASSLPLLATGAVCIAAAGLAGGIGWSLGKRADRRAAGRVAGHAAAAGIAAADGATMPDEVLMARLAERTEGASAAESAFAEMRLPALICDANGVITAVSRGLRELQPHAAPGATIDTIYGEGFLAEGGGAAEQSLVALGGRRYDAQQRNLGAARRLITLSLAGIVVGDDDMDAFALAVADGRTAFRFADTAVARNPALGTLNEGLAALDQAAAALKRVAAGPIEGEPAGGALRGDLARQYRALTAEMQRLREAAATETLKRVDAETRLTGLTEAVDECRRAIATLAEIATRVPAARTARKGAGRGTKRGAAAPPEPSTADADAVPRTLEALDARLRALGIAPGVPPDVAASNDEASESLPNAPGGVSAEPPRGALAIAARRLRAAAANTDPAPRQGAGVH